jgi:hypothetical protein
MLAINYNQIQATKLKIGKFRSLIENLMKKSQ